MEEEHGIVQVTEVAAVVVMILVVAKVPLLQVLEDRVVVEHLYQFLDQQQFMLAVVVLQVIKVALQLPLMVEVVVMAVMLLELPQKLMESLEPRILVEVVVALLILHMMGELADLVS